MAIHLVVSSDKATTAKVVDMTEAGQRGKKARTFSLYAKVGNEAANAFVNALPGLSQGDNVEAHNGGVFIDVPFSDFVKQIKLAILNDDVRVDASEGEIKAVDCPVPVLTFAGEGFGVVAGNGGTTLALSSNRFIFDAMNQPAVAYRLTQEAIDGILSNEETPRTFDAVFNALVDAGVTFRVSIDPAAPAPAASEEPAAPAASEEPAAPAASEEPAAQ